MRRLLLNRFFVVPATLCAVTLAWNLYVLAHAHGVIEGRVVEPDGRPASGATVVLYHNDFVTQVEHARTRADADGNFRFANNDSHLIQLQAIDGDAVSARATVRLWFRAQDRKLTEPLKLGGH